MAGESVGGWTQALSAAVVRHARLVIGAWIGLVVLLNLTIPQIETVVEHDSTSFVPLDAPAVVGSERMDKEFGNGKSASFVQVIAYRDGGLTAGDRQYVLDLAPRLRADKANVTFVQDLTKDDVREALTSKDDEAMYLPVGIPGATGAPAANAQIDSVRDVAEVGRPDGLTVEVTGTSATIRDMVHAIESSLGTITIAVLVIIAIVVMLLYRSFAVTALILGVIGLALGTARAVTSFAGLHLFGISTFTGSIMTVVVLGAATDYAVFLISRYHEFRRSGMPVRQSAYEAGSRISGIIVGSALTVAIANAAMLLADVAFFNTTGPAVALSVMSTLALSVTLTPAVLVVAGEHGLMEPRPARGTDQWERIGALVVSHPVRVLIAGLIPLVSLAAFYPAMGVTYDERVGQPSDSESNRGFKLMDEHFPVNEVLPNYVVIFSPHDVRTPGGLAAIDRATDEVKRLDGIRSVRGITRPGGNRIKQASVGYQAGRVGDRLDDAADDVEDGSDDVQKLVDGAEKLDSGAGKLEDGSDRLADGADRAVDGAEKLLDGADRLHDGVTRLADGADEARDGSKQLRDAADQLADGLEAGQDQVKVAVDGLGLAYDALANKSVTCGVDPACAAARDGIKRIYEAERDQLLPGIGQAADAARQIADGSVTLKNGLDRIARGLDRAHDGTSKLRDGEDLFASKMSDLSDGADRLHDGTEKLDDGAGKVSDGTQEAADSIDDLQDGLDKASMYLTKLGRVSRDPSVSGFYLPAKALENEKLVTAASLYLSSDAHTTRLFVLDKRDANSRTAALRTSDIKAAVERGLAGTELEGSRIELTGTAAFNTNLHDLSQADFWTVATVALIAVLIILIVMLRSVLAPIFLLGSVILSYAAAMGLSVLFWQIWLDKPLDWSVPPMTFVMLVAVGADYNLLLMKRIQEEAADGSKAGIGRAVTLTGSVITAAGLIFAFSMFAMLFGSALGLKQTGFTVGMGLLLDTFVVRTFIVPSVAALLGPSMWWPRKVEYWTVPHSSEVAAESVSPAAPCAEWCELAESAGGETTTTHHSGQERTTRGIAHRIQGEASFPQTTRYGLDASSRPHQRGRMELETERLTGRRPLICTADEAYLDCAVQWCSAVGTTPDVAHDTRAAQMAWREASFVVVGTDLATSLGKAGVSRREGVFLLAGSTIPASAETAVALGVDGVLRTEETDEALRALTAAVDGRGEGCMVSVIGGAGGSGASTLAAGLAVGASRRGMRTLLLDADPIGGGVDLLMGAEHVDGVRWDTIATQEGPIMTARSLAEVLPRHDGVSMLSFGRDPIAPKSLSAIVAASLRGFDVVVADVGRQAGAWGAQSVATSVLTVIVVPEDVRALSASKAVRACLGPDAGSVVAVTAARRAGIGRDTIADALGVPVVGRLRYDPRLRANVDHGLGLARSGPVRRAVRPLLDIVAGST